MYILETKNLCKYYRKTHALEHVDMTIEKGDIYGFVGKNGAGKTTLIRIITGVAEPTSGTYALFGESEPRKRTRVRARMAAVVESPALHMGLTAFENLELQCTLLGINKDVKQFVENLLEKVGLSSLLVSKRKKVKNFSLGMKQRLGIAMAMISNPEFLVLDEPNNGLDPEGIRDMRELLLKLNHEDGITILISSHILSELSKLATRYGFIEKGKIVKEITAEELARVSRKATLIRVDKPSVAHTLLTESGYKNIELLKDAVTIPETVAVSKIVTLLAKGDVEVINIQEQNEDLEQYFMEIIKEAQHG
jgi:ABC-2 type transport system ATP-binding protein